MSIQWGGFADIGAAAALDIRGRRLSYRGGASFAPAEGLEAFRRLLAHPRAEIGVLRMDMRQWVEFYPSTTEIPFFAELLKQRGRANTTTANEFLEHLRMARPEERANLMEKHLLQQISAVLHLDPARIDRLVPLQSIGMDSLMSLELRNRLERSLGLKLSATILFKFATTAALTGHLQDLLFPPSQQPVLLEQKSSSASSAEREFIQKVVSELSEQDVYDELAREVFDE